MNKKKFRAQRRLLILLILLTLSLIGFVVGKYVQVISMDKTVTFTASLAEVFELRESKAVRQSNGTYELSQTETISNDTQSYSLLPGLDVPKDPHIVITGKTEVPAYLYLEVVDGLANDALKYDLEEHWKTTAAKTPQHEGTVYVYCADKTDPTVITTDQTKIKILKENMFYVGQKLLSGDETNALEFYAYLEEAVPANP